MSLSLPRVRCRTLALILAGLLAAVTASAADFRVAGSDLLGPEFSKVLGGFTAPDGTKLTVSLEGSRLAYEALKEGRVEVAVLALPAGEEPDEALFESVTLAWHRIVVIVPEAVPLDRITLPQLAAIFGADGPTSYNRWGDLGLKDEWANSPLTPHAPATGLGFTGEFFRRAVLGGGAFKSYVGRYTSVPDLALRLAGDSRALAVAPGVPPRAPGLKLLAVAAHPDDPAFSPTAENLRSGDYPLRLPLRVVFHREAVGRVLPLLRFLSDEAAVAALERADLVAEPLTARRQRLLGLEKK